MIVDMRADAGGNSHGDHPAIGPRPVEDALDLAGHDPAWMLGVEPEGTPRRWVLPAVAALLCVLWLGAMLWLVRDDVALLNPVALVELIAALAVVPALIGIVCLLAMRTSRAEARRFGDTARAMRTEASNLERTVAVLARSLDSNRRVLAEQIGSLMTMGDGANERLLAVGRGLAGEIAAAEAHARTLRDAATDAQASVDVLLATLPRAQDEIDAARQQLEESGVTAGRHAAALEGQLAALAERGRDADLIAGGAAQRLAAHLARMEATSETAGARLESVTGEMSDAVDALLGRTADAVDEARKGIATQGDAMLAMLRANQAALDSAARDSAEALAERIGAVEDIIDRVVARLEKHRAASDDMIVVIDAEVDRVELRMDALHTQGVERSQMLAASISALGGSADAMTEALRAGEAMATRTIGTTESLLIALDAAAREIDETLPEALARLDARIASSKQVVVAAKPELLALVTAAESTHDAIEAIAGVIADQRRTLDQLSSTLLQTLNEGRDKADALGSMVDETIGRTHRFAEEAAPRLVEALLRVRDTASTAADKARETLATVIPEAAEALEGASAEAMRRAASDTVERQVRAIGDATDEAVAAATRATERLSAQVQQILDKTALVETRIEDARTERDEADRNSFARRASLLIESLNSAAIDVTKAFAPEVSDSAWAAYLKGDRGVFTRRAVRILEPADAREIARLYDDDSAFRETVNRYIHDFESMLRTILTQRDGSPLGVTLLSSDMGKLYVALAQAIERLR